MHFLSAHFDCFPFYHRDIKSIIDCIYISMILQTLAVNLGPHQKCSQLGPAVPKAGPGNKYYFIFGIMASRNGGWQALMAHSILGDCIKAFGG